MASGWGCVLQGSKASARALGKFVQPCSLWAAQATESSKPLCGGEGRQKLPWVDGVCNLQAGWWHAWKMCPALWFTCCRADPNYPGLLSTAAPLRCLWRSLGIYRGTLGTVCTSFPGQVAGSIVKRKWMCPKLNCKSASPRPVSSSPIFSLQGVFAMRHPSPMFQGVQPGGQRQKHAGVPLGSHAPPLPPSLLRVPSSASM